MSILLQKLSAAPRTPSLPEIEDKKDYNQKLKEKVKKANLTLALDKDVSVESKSLGDEDRDKSNSMSSEEYNDLRNNLRNLKEQPTLKQLSDFRDSIRNMPEHEIHGISSNIRDNDTFGFANRTLIRQLGNFKQVQLNIPESLEQIKYNSKKTFLSPMALKSSKGFAIQPVSVEQNNPTGNIPKILVLEQDVRNTEINENEDVLPKIDALKNQEKPQDSPGNRHIKASLKVPSQNKQEKDRFFKKMKKQFSKLLGMNTGSLGANNIEDRFQKIEIPSTSRNLAQFRSSNRIYPLSLNQDQQDSKIDDWNDESRLKDFNHSGNDEIGVGFSPSVNTSRFFPTSLKQSRNMCMDI